MAVDGLEGAVEIYRDSYGIPHVRAGSTRDAFFGQAFAAAQDRLWHMQHDRLVAYGRWAEYAGPDVLEQDVQMRRFQIGPSVRLDYEHLNDEARAMLEAYAAGVNAFIDSGPLPAELALVDDAPERWEPWDCLAVFKGRHILMGVFEAKLWRAKLLEALGPEKAPSCCRATGATCSSCLRPPSTTAPVRTPCLTSPISKAPSARCARPTRAATTGRCPARGPRRVDR